MSDNNTVMHKGWGINAPRRERLPQPVQEGWKKGILEVREGVPADFLPRELFSRPDRPQLVEAPILRAMMAQLVPPTDEELIVWAEQSKQDLEGHMEGMWGILGERACFARASRALVHHLFNTYAPGKKLSVMEMGCGPELLLWELAPPRLQDHWQAFDVEETFVKLAQQKVDLFHLPVTVERRNAYQPFAGGSVEPFPDLLVGLSSFDAIDPSLALKALAAPRGTRFIHLQDLYPGVAPLITFDRKFPTEQANWLVAQTQPVMATLGMIQEHLAHNCLEAAFALFHEFMMNRERVWYLERDGQVLSPVEEFHDRLVFCLEQAGFKIVKQGLVSAVYLGRRLPQHERLLQVAQSEGAENPNAFVNIQGDYIPMLHSGVRQYHSELGLSFHYKRAFLEITVANFVVAEKE